MGVKGGEGLFGEGPSLSGAISTTDILQQQFKNCTNERLKIKNKKNIKKIQTSRDVLKQFRRNQVPLSAARQSGGKKKS